MRMLVGTVLAGLLLGGCVVYSEPVAPRAYVAPPAVYVAPPPVVVGPAYPWWWHHRSWRNHY